MIGVDDSVFSGSKKVGNTTDRLALYLDTLRRIEPRSTLTDLIFTPHSFQPISPQDGLRLIPVKASHVQIFPLAGFIAALRDHSILQADLITAQTPFECGLLGLMLKSLCNARLEIQIHLNLFSPYWLAEHRLLNRLRMSLARYVIKRADAIRVVSSTVKETLTNNWGIPADIIAVIPVPVFYKEPIGTAINNDMLVDPNGKVVLFVGRLSPSKNLPVLFAVCEKILADRTDVNFVLIGDGPQRAYANQQAAQLNQHRVQVLGNIPHSELPHWYRRADVLVLPSLHEGFARVLVESYLFDTPAVATRCGGPEDIIIHGETGYLTDIGDIDDFSRRVLWLLEHPDQARQMGTQGHVHVETKFEPHFLTKKIVQVWKSTSEPSK